MTASPNAAFPTRLTSCLTRNNAGRADVRIAVVPGTGATPIKSIPIVVQSNTSAF